MQQRLQRFIATLLLVAVGAFVAGCGLEPASQFSPNVTADSIPTDTSLNGASITVTSKDFTEQILLGKITVLVLKAAGADVEDRTNLAGATARQALERGEADMMWEYTGTAWFTDLGQDQTITDPQRLFDAVAAMDLSRNHIAWLPAANFNNTFAFVVTGKSAQQYGLSTLSDMARTPMNARTYCVVGEFFARPDGFIPMLAAYGLTYGSDVPAGNVKQMAAGVIFSELGRGGCTFGQANTTDGRISADDLTVLDDDKHFFPPYYPAPNVRESVLKRHPELTEVFSKVSERLDVDAMRRLNEAVDVDGEDPAFVARDWLRDEGFIE